MKKKKVIAIIIAVVVVLIAVFAGIGIYNTPANRIARQMDVAEKYLAEMDYEQAVVEFTKAIEIDPMNAGAYLGLAEAYKGLGDTDMVVQTLVRGYETTNNAKMLEFPIQWEDKTFEKIIRERLGKAEGDIRWGELQEVTHLYICGDFAATAIIRGDDSKEMHTTAKYRDLNDNEVEITQRGSLHSLKDLQYFIWLQSLRIAFQDFDDGIGLSDLGRLPNLRELQLYDNNISDISGVSSLTNLKHLELRYNNISDISGVSSLTNLETLNLPNNNISDISGVSSLTNLKLLNLGSNNISDISVLGSLTNLEVLALDSNNISDISVLGSLIGLEELSLSKNNISDISALESLTNLKWLHMYYNNVSDVSALGNLTNLEFLGLYYNNISDFSPVSFVPKLEADYQFWDTD